MSLANIHVPKFRAERWCGGDGGGVLCSAVPV